MKRALPSSVPEYRGPKRLYKIFSVSGICRGRPILGQVFVFCLGDTWTTRRENRTQHFRGSHSVGQHGTDVFSSGVVADLSDLFSEFASRLFGRSETSHRKVAAKAKRLSPGYVDCIKLVIRFAGQFM